MIALRVRGRASSSWGSVAAAELGSGAAGARGRWGGPGPRTSSPWDAALSDQDTVPLRSSPGCGRLLPGTSPHCSPARRLPALPARSSLDTALLFPGTAPRPGGRRPGRSLFPPSTAGPGSQPGVRAPRASPSCAPAEPPGLLGRPASARPAPGLQVVPRGKPGPLREVRSGSRAVSGGPALRVSRAPQALLGKADLNSNFPVTLVAKHCGCRAPELTFSCCTFPNYRQKGLVGLARTGPLSC